MEGYGTLCEVTGIWLKVDALKAQELCAMSSEGLWIELGRFLTLGRVFATYAQECELRPQHYLQSQASLYSIDNSNPVRS